MIDKQGKEYARLSRLKMGDQVVVDAGFTCMEPGATKFVCSDAKQGHRLFLSCDQGEHYLDGQLADDIGEDGDSLIGIYKV